MKTKGYGMKTTAGVCLLAWLLLPGTFAVARGGSMKIKTADTVRLSISNTPMIYALYGQYGLIRNMESVRNSLMINKIRIENTGKTPVTVESCSLSLKSRGTTYVQTFLDKEWITQDGKNGAKDMTNPRRQEVFKSNPFYVGSFVPGPEVGAGQSLVLQNQYFDTYTSKPVDEVVIDCTLKDGRHAKASFKVGAYEQKNSYIFPMKGDLAVVGGPHHIWGHRMTLMSEFAFDVMSIKESRFYKNAPFKPENHFCFGQEVLAPADGVVVSADDSVADNRVPYDYAAIEKQAAEQPKDLSIIVSSGGNQITIDHGKSEFSSFLHLQKGSVRVKKGDTVKQGQVIATCGNSGTGSTSPHLHVQFMNTADMAHAVGLPITFTNLDNGAFSDTALKRMSLPPEFEKLFSGWGVEFAVVKTR